MNSKTSPIQLPDISPAVKNQGKQRILGLDIIRALAIVLVVLQHAMPDSLHSDTGSVADLLCGPNAVLFIVLSGALLLPLSKDSGTFFRHRAVRVIIPFIFWSMIYAWDNWSNCPIEATNYWLAEQIRWTLLNPTFEEGYFIPVIIGLYLFYPVISPWIKGASKRAMIWFLAIWCVALTLPYLTIVMGVKDYQFTLVGTFYNYLGFAVAGCYFMRYPLNKESRKKAIIMIASAITIAYILPLLMRNTLFTLDISSTNLSLPVAMAAMLLFALLSPIQRPQNPGATTLLSINIISVIARYSYVIYLIHPLVIRILSRDFPEMTDSWLLFPITFTISLTLSYIVSHTPCIRHFLS